MRHSTLEFVPDEANAYLAALRRFATFGCRRACVRNWTRTARLCAERRAEALPPDFELLVAEDVGAGTGHGLPMLPDAERDADPRLCHVLFQDSVAQVDARLHGFIDRDATIIAPALPTTRRPLSVVTVPKSGTHLLLEILHEFGYLDGGVLPKTPQPGSRYLPNASPHIPVRSLMEAFDADDITAGYDDPLWKHPVLFMYRNPLDVLCSEVSWYSKPGATYLAHHFGRLDPDEVLRRLITGDGTVTDLAERIDRFSGWLEFPNVIPVSYEELVGARGGGSQAEQTRLIWSLQLKLRVPGSPENYGRLLGRRGSHTFNKGRIGRYRTELTHEHYALIEARCTDYFAHYGYDYTELRGGLIRPLRADEFRTRAACPFPEVSTCTHQAPHSRPAAVTPAITGPVPYRDYTIAPFRDRFVALPRAKAMLRLPEELATPGLLVGLDVDELKAAIDERHAAGVADRDDNPETILYRRPLLLRIMNAARHRIVNQVKPWLAPQPKKRRAA